jgi:hypothetical protein
MDKRSIRSHLKPYSIFQKRRTTINHAFASALAPNDNYDERVIDKALEILGQNPNGDLYCVYCRGEAHTWDHLVGLVKDAQLRGYGHQIGNLVPCCRHCNSKKGSKDWRQFIESEIRNEESRSALVARIETYLNRFAKPINIEQIEKTMPEDWAKYASIKNQIFGLMIEADEVAERIRNRAV